MLIPWLLKYDGYPPGVVVALLLHGLLMYIFLPKEFDPADQVRIEPASFAVASATQQSPQRLRRLQQQTQRQAAEAEKERQRQRDDQRKRDEAAAAERQRVAEQQRQREAEQEKQRVAEQQRQREADQEKQRQQDQERERQREADRQRQAQEQAAADAARSAAAAAANAQAQGVEQQMVAQYAAIIRDLVSQAWSRSPDAKNGMVAIVQIRLTPTGEIVSSQIVQGSGSAAFDRSVQQAVDRVGNISELQDMPTPIFERYFRNFNLEFRPEDLLR
jgi:colicin import membrane protein